MGILINQVKGAKRLKDIERACCIASGRFKRAKGKNMTVSRLGKKGHRKNCRKVR